MVRLVPLVAIGVMHMQAKKIITVASIVLFAVTLSSCGNTIRGMGKDAANTVDATKSAGHRVARAAN